ncbi:DNA polymerase III, delta prime subunit [Nitrosospira sp. Nl5]|uniref:DNA polymerase III subunit delta' n=1 Tax=Nitrosospira sp. Nl5 TaxID=200120 RepID=UPI00088140F4|nr:DNA polymerase III subunit delta' [Nitrosospira sp. Nl5]SCY08958.1 DNA polymerase III, delta prime subunit [Nitrosospira sp. Nl5]
MNAIYPWQKDVWRILAQVAEIGTSGSASMSHALLLRGRRGIGKLALATHLAKFRLCKNPSIEGEACLRCASCRWFEQGNHPDFRLVEPEAISVTSGSASGARDEGTLDSPAGVGEEGADGVGAVESGSAKSRKKPSKEILISQIRELGDFINISSHQNGYKIVLIHPAEAMKPAAANALLKNLEEPPARTLFILVTHRAQHLLPTIRSRCRQIAMPAPDLATATAWLKQQGVKDPATCLASAGYAPLAALEFNDDTYLGRHEAFIRQISAPGNFNPVALAEEMQKSDLPTVVNWLQKWCYDLMSFRTTRKIRYHLEMRATIKSLASGIDPRALATYLRALNATHRLAHHPLNPRLFLEEMLFSYVMSVAPASRTPGQAQ